MATPLQIIDGYSLTADEIVETINKADMTYITNFDVTIYQQRPEADAPYMEELAINGQQSSEENQ